MTLAAMCVFVCVFCALELSAFVSGKWYVVSGDTGASDTLCSLECSLANHFVHQNGGSEECSS